MLTKHNLILFFLIVYTSATAQKLRQQINGQILYKKSNLSEVHIINLNTGEGAISDDFGKFRISAGIADILLVSSIQFVNQHIRLTATIFNKKYIEIVLVPQVKLLDEVFLHGLSGDLMADLLKIPPDSIPRHNFSYALSDLDKILPPDTKGPLAAPNALKMTDPTYMGGGGVKAALPDKRFEAMKEAKRKLALRKTFPDKIRNVLGNDFFLVLLKIPEERIYHFISYCEHRKIFDLYEKKDLLAIIQIFREESKNYLAFEH
jgi:hypothetical protein